MKDRGATTAKTILRKKNNVERISLISRHHVVTVKTGCYWPRDRSVEQDREGMNRSTQVCPTDFVKGSKTIQWRRDNLFNKWCWGKKTLINQKKKK